MGQRACPAAAGASDAQHAADVFAAGYNLCRIYAGNAAGSAYRFHRDEACEYRKEFRTAAATVSAYAAAKGGLKMLTRNICSEYGQYNIQCNAIGPGYIATPQTAPLRARGEDGSISPFDRFIRSKTPARRWGTTDDLQGLAVFLASHASDFVNGQIVYIDGGILAYIGQDPSQLDESQLKEVAEDSSVKVNDR